MKYIINYYYFFFSSKVAGANVRVGGQMRRAPACFDTPVRAMSADTTTVFIQKVFAGLFARQLSIIVVDSLD